MKILPYALLWSVIFISCGRGKQAPRIFSQDSLAVFRLLARGDSVYATKQSYRSFAQTLKSYDSAATLASRYPNSLLQAEALFAKARVYDAWNKEPLITAQLFEEAAAKFERLPGKSNRYNYVRHLVAHAYEKAQDSARAVVVLLGIFNDFKNADSVVLRQMPFTAEMALIATQVRNFNLADSILNRLTKRSWIENDPATYDYLDHYYLTQSRLDAYVRKPGRLLFLDSLAAVAQKSHKAIDEQYYQFNLAELYQEHGLWQQALVALRRSDFLRDSLNNFADMGTMQAALLESELLAERQQRGFEEQIRSGREVANYMLSIFLAVITILSIYLYRRNKKYRKQSASLRNVNEQLDEKVEQVELLNKEIQHRLKNNLYMIYSLLEMQERKSTNPETIAQLQTARLRVESIASLHNHLLGSPAAPDFETYIRRLITTVAACSAQDKSVAVELHTDSIFLNEKQYLALSLILNEWVTNSIKYASERTLVLSLEITNQSGGVLVSYHDNGQHPPKPAVEGLGTKIIALLSSQLRATLTALPGQPYHYQLFIPQPSQACIRTKSTSS